MRTTEITKTPQGAPTGNSNIESGEAEQRASVPAALGTAAPRAERSRASLPSLMAAAAGGKGSAAREKP
jgi:hypothetical protein